MLAVGSMPRKLCARRIDYPTPSPEPSEPVLANTLPCCVLTTAFAQALRDYIAEHDRPLAALDCAARSISDVLAGARGQAAAVAAPGYDELAAALRMAVKALWIEYGGDPGQMPTGCDAPH